MWFEYDGENVRFTHTNKRGKYRNLQRNPSMSLLLIDDTNPQSYLEVRGRLAEAIPDPGGCREVRGPLVGATRDPEGEFYVRLGRRYGDPDTEPPPDRADRVMLVM